MPVSTEGFLREALEGQCDRMRWNMAKSPIALIASSLLALALMGYLGYQWRTTARTLETTKAELASTTVASAIALKNAETDNQQLAQALEQQRLENEQFQGQIEDISGTVGKLDKLAKIDPELLQKYSKVYFLNENFIPELTQIPQKFVSDDHDEYFQKEAWSYLENMLEDAEEDGVNILITSAYRSFGTQGLLKSSYTVTYGSGANKFSADQGYSEHQLGTTADFTSKENGGTLSGFDATAAYAWLQKHAFRYGFILSYPKGNTYYVYEPWHWRFVGRDLAEDLHDDEKHFYDLDQRDIDTYLINLFD